MKDVILDYLTKQCLKDDFLNKHFDKAKIDGCIEHINAEARKVIKGNSGYIADEVVFKWARDYFVDEIYLGKTQETKKQVEGQFDMFNFKLAEIAHEIDKINLNELTPIDALNTLVKIKEKMK